MLIGDLQILLVEDHSLQRAVLLHLLEALGARNVQSAADGRAAMALMQAMRSGPDIIITDMDMPGMDGMEFLRRIGEAGRPVSVIVASAAGESVLSVVEGMARAYRVQVIGVLRKPVTLAALGRLVRRHASGGASSPMEPLPCRVHTVAEIEHGLRRGQFEPYFQPKLELGTGRLCGLEALARWRRPGENIIAPAAFLPALEGETVLMEELTWQMLTKSVAACAAWRKKGLETAVSVNIAAGSLADVEFGARLAAMVRNHGLSARDLTLEITESAAVQLNSGAAMENVARLRLRGFGLACDDFGTGYATTEQLARLPFTQLKIDQGFLRKARHEAAARTILRSTVEMANHLKLESVGEGVETQQEWDLLWKLGCDVAQGNFIAAPMEAADVVPWSNELYNSSFSGTTSLTGQPMHQR